MCYLEIIDTFFENYFMYDSYCKLTKELKSGTEILVGQSVGLSLFSVMDKNSQNIVLFNNSGTACPY